MSGFFVLGPDDQTPYRPVRENTLVEKHEPGMCGKHCPAVGGSVSESCDVYTDVITYKMHWTSVRIWRAT